MTKTLRKSTVSLDSANSEKLRFLDELSEEYLRVVNHLVYLAWKHEIFSGAWLDYIFVKHMRRQTWLSPYVIMCAGQQALHIVKSQRKRKPHKRTRPVFRKKSIDLGKDVVKIKEGGNSFDLWICLHGLGRGGKLFLPARRHVHFNGFSDWRIKPSLKLRKAEGKWYADIYFEKEIPKKTEGKTIGLDTGYKKLAVTSEKQMIGQNLEKKMAKIARKRQKSKAFFRALTERDQYINREVKKIDLESVMTIVVENLKNLHHGKKKFSKKFRNKFQRWVYAQFLERLEQTCELSGVHVRRVCPSYTSQTCSGCGDVHNKNRNGEIFRCGNCGHTMDADYNASLNILNRFEQEYVSPVYEKS